MSDDTNIQTNWTADFSGVVGAFDNVTDASTNAFDSLAQHAKAAAEAAGDAHAHIGDSAQEAGEHVHEEGVNIGESLEGIKHSFDELKEITGIAFLSEALEKITETIEAMTGRAVQISNMSQVLGTTTDQYQALSAAAEEAGVSEGVMEHATERLVSMLQQARLGSADAEDKLHQLGITNANIADTSFGLIDALGIIHERLEESSTATSEYNAILQAFGVRGALAAQAFKEFDGSAEGVADKLTKINALTADQIAELAELHARVGEIGTSWDNFWSQRLVNVADNIGGTYDRIKGLITEFQSIDWDSLGGADKTNAPGQGADSGFAASLVAQEKQREEMAQTAKGFYDDIIDYADQAAQQELAAASAVAEGREVLTAQDLAREQASLAEFKSGTEERLAALRKYAEDVAATYTSNTPQVAAANAQVLEADRQLNDERKRFIESADEEILTIETQINNQRVSLSKEYRASVEADIEAVRKDQQTTLDRQLAAEMAYLSLVDDASANAYKNGQLSAQQEYRDTANAANEKLQAQQAYYAQLAQLYEGDYEKQREIQGKEAVAVQQNAIALQKAQEKLVNDLRQQWSGVSNAMSNSLAQGLSGMLEGTQTFAGAMRNVFSSLVEALIQKFVEWGVQQLETLILTKVATASTAEAQISSYAAVAAAAAAASVAAIPFYGWAMAPEVQASTLAEVMSLESIPAFAGGSSGLPKDMFAQVHQNEMVLPARFNAGLTNMVNSFANGENAPSKSNRGGFVLNAKAVSDSEMLVKKGDLVNLINQANNQFKFNRRR